MAQTNEFRNAKRRLKRHLDRIAEVDEEVAEALVTLGYPEPRLRERGFVTFLNIIISQQISTSAARAIRGRVFDLMPEVSARAFLKVEATRFREAGLSARKVEYATGLAEATIEGRFTPDRLSDLDDEEAIEHIVSLRGFGRWSAEIYLMFSLQRPDIFPADDLALQVGLQRLKALEEKPTGSEARELIAPWAPWRSAGSLFLWHYYQGAPA